MYTSRFHKLIYRLVLLSIVACSVFILTGCGRDYVCYNGVIQKNLEDCPTLPTLTVTDANAQRIVDSYGMAIANARHDFYTRVNIYSKNATWYANVMFSNSQTKNVAKVLLQINGQTGDVSCVTGCEYLSEPEVPVQDSTVTSG